MNSFTEQALVFIGSAVLFVPLFRKLGLGSVLGYLVAGVLVGPWGFGLIKNAESVLHFSELGVVLLLFVIGLEIQPHKLWSMRKHLFGLGGLQILLSTLIFTTIGLAFDLSLIAAGVIGFGLSLSSTAFALQMLTEKNQFNTEFGRTSFAILLAQDLAAIPALAVIPALAAQGGESVSYTKILSALALIVSLIVGSRFLVRPVLQRLAEMRSREIFTAAILFIVLGVAELMQTIGLSAALGTFIAGVLLADSEYRHEIEADLEPFKSLLLGLFFISVGMSVSLGSVIEHPLTVVALTLTYVIIKHTVIFFSARVFGFKTEIAKLTALSVGQGGEFAFVIFAIAARLSLGSSEILNLLTVVITISMVLSPVFLKINERITRMRLSRKGEELIYDQIKDESPEVILAGFGRVGQVVARILRAQDIPFVAIDHNAEQIELVRRFGNKVYYGDVSRLDILEAAGAARAKYFVLAIANIDTSLKAVELVKANFPNLKIFARARNRGHVFELFDLGIKKVKRDTFDSSVNFAKDLLVDLGYEQTRANLIIQKFKDHDNIMLEEQYKVRRDDKMFVSVSKQAVEQLAQVLRDDLTQSHIAPSVNTADSTAN